MPFWAILSIILGSIILLTLLVVAVFIFIIDCTIKQSLEEAVESVRYSFTTTIEELEPGKISNGGANDQLS